MRPCARAMSTTASAGMASAAFSSDSRANAPASANMRAASRPSHPCAKREITERKAWRGSGGGQEKGQEGWGGNLSVKSRRP
eukprot:1184391-Prorocentrum_minimum.AAC.1